MKILVVGVHGFGKIHLSAIKDMEISIVERNEDTVKDVLSRFDIKKVYKSYEEALNDNFDIVDLTVPHYLHSEMAIKAMKKKINVLIEKPIATTVNEASIMIKTARENNVKFMVSDQYYFDPSVREAVKIINEKRIGNINAIIVRDQRFYDHKGWRQKQDSMGGGALLDGGIHYIDTMLNFGGHYSKIYGYTGKGGSTLEGEDTTTALFRFENNITGLFFYSWSYIKPPELPAFEIIGDNGSLYEDYNSRTDWDINSKIRTVYGDLIMNGKKLNLKKYDVYTYEISQFKKSIENDTEVPFPPELALRDLKAVLEIYNNK